MQESAKVVKWVNIFSRVGSGLVLPTLLLG